MSATDQPTELASQLATEMTRCRQRGLNGLDKADRKQSRIEAAELERLAQQYCQFKGFELHGRIAQIRRLLRDGLDAYIQRGYETDGTFIKELFFGDDTTGARVKNAGQLLDNALRRHSQTQDWFSSRRPDLFQGLATFLIVFVNETPSVTVNEINEISNATGADATPIATTASTGRKQPAGRYLLIVAVMVTGISGVLWFTTRESSATRQPYDLDGKKAILLPDTGKTYPQTSASSLGAATFTDPYSVDTLGPRIEFLRQVQVSCKVYSPVIPSVGPKGYWYRIASPPWNNDYYAPANSFLNGDPPHGPYTGKDIDETVPDCPTTP